MALRSRSPTAVTPIPCELARSAGRRTGGGGEPAGGEEPACTGTNLETGSDDHTIAATLAAVRDFDPQCEGAYIPRTIRAARLHIQNREA